VDSQGYVGIGVGTWDATSPTLAAQLVVDGNIYPEGAGHDLGTTGTRWDNIYANHLYTSDVSNSGGILSLLAPTTQEIRAVIGSTTAAVFDETASQLRHTEIIGPFGYLKFTSPQYSVQIPARLDTGTAIEGDIVVLNGAASSSYPEVAKVAVNNDARAIGIVGSGGMSTTAGYMIVMGVVTTVNHGVGVSAGQYVVTNSTTAGKAGDSSSPTGAIGIWLETATVGESPSAAFIYPVQDHP